METNFKKRKPIIGIVTKHYLKNDIRPDMYIRDEVRQVIYDNDGIAIGITLPKDELVDVCDNWSNNLTKEECNDLIIQINLCDLMCTDKIYTLDKRMMDLLLRHGVYKNTQYHIKEAYKLKEYFDNLLGYNLYDLFPEIKENL